MFALNLGPLEHILGYQKTDNFLPINVIILAVKTYIFQIQECPVI